MLTLACRSFVKSIGRNRRLGVTATFSSSSSSSSPILQGYDLSIDECNIPPKVVDLVGRNLHLQKNHPLNTIKSIIEDYWRDREGADFCALDDLSPIVSTHENFDSLLIPQDHVSRRKSDTYYLNNDTLLRCHTSAHQSKLLKQGMRKFLVTGDVYRKDEIDATHYPVFHQMEGVKVFEDDDLMTVENDLKEGLEGMVRAVFGDVEMKWSADYFPFTDPSFELEINYQDKWLEVLGCGVMQPQILRDANISSNNNKAWAFGLGLERLAMILFEIPDIRLFWSQDTRFLEQFESSGSSKIFKFQPFSKYPPVFKDIAFWLGDEFHPNDLAEVVREVAGDLVERVELIDAFTHPKTERESNCFRITYRSMDRSLTDEEINELQAGVREQAETVLGVELR